jgi:hypothetical protein
VNHSTRSARTPLLRTGLFAPLRGLLGGGGSGALSHDGIGLGVGGRTSSLRLLGLLVTATAALLAPAAIPASALAARGHVFKGSFGTEGFGPGQLDEPSDVAVSFINRVSSALGWARSLSPAASRPAFRVRGRFTHDVYVVNQGAPA